MTWVAAGVASGAATHAAIQYFHNKKKIAEDAKNRPQYQIPDEIKQNLSQAQQQALQGLPEEQKQQYLSNLQRSSAYGLNQLGTRKAGLSGVADVNQNENQGYQSLLSADSQAKQQNQQALMGARQTMADYKDQSFQLNKVNPYYEGIAARNANEGALSKSLSNAGQLGAGGFMGAGQRSQQRQPSQEQTMNYYRNTPQSGGYGGGGYDYMNQQNRNNQNSDFNPSQYS